MAVASPILSLRWRTRPSQTDPWSFSPKAQQQWRQSLISDKYLLCCLMTEWKAQKHLDEKASVEPRRESELPHFHVRGTDSPVGHQLLGSRFPHHHLWCMDSFQQVVEKPSSASDSVRASSQSPLQHQDAAARSPRVSDTCTLQNMAVSVRSGLGNHFPLPYLYARLGFAFCLGFRLTQISEVKWVQ